MVIVGTVAAAAFFMLVLYWWSEGIFDTSEALLLDGIFCILIFGLFASQTTGQFLMAFIPLSAAGAYALYSYHVGGMRSYLRNRSAEYMRAIQADPRNLAARQRLAETLYLLGELDRAVAEMQAAVDMGADAECRYRLSRWILEQRARDSGNPVCKWCGTESPAGTRRCPRCSSELPCRSALGRWLIGGRWASARLILLILMGTALISASLALLPLEYAFIPLALLGLALTGWALIRSAGA